MNNTLSYSYNLTFQSGLSNFLRSFAVTFVKPLRLMPKNADALLKFKICELFFLETKGIFMNLVSAN